MTEWTTFSTQKKNIAAVAESVHADWGESNRHISWQLGWTYGMSWRIIRQNLKLKAYKTQIVQKLKPFDLPKQHWFVLWALEKFKENLTYLQQILFSDED